MPTNKPSNKPSYSDIAYRGLAATLGGPVDLATMVMRPFGYSTPDRQVVGGSEWIGKQMEQAGLVGTARAPWQEFAASLVSPSGAAKGVALGVPALAGMMRTPLGRIPETYSDTNKLADMLVRAGEAKGYDVSHSGSAISPSQYVTFSKDGIERQVRLSNHPDKYPELARGVRTSVDPETGVSFEQAVNWLAREGFPTRLSTKYKDVPTWEQYYKEQGKIRDLENAANAAAIKQGNALLLEKLKTGDYLSDDIVKVGIGSKGRKGYDFLGHRFEAADIPDHIKTNPDRNVLKEYLANKIRERNDIPTGQQPWKAGELVSESYDTPLEDIVKKYGNQ